jgi:AP-3 complex subunit delta-1
MWERTLQDLIRGLRANKKDEATFINKAVDEIREEIKSKDMELKAGAIMKLTYVSVTLWKHVIFYSACSSLICLVTT